MFDRLFPRHSNGLSVCRSAFAHIAAGNDARGRGAWREAAEAYRRALDLEPGLAHIWIQLGHAEKEQGKRERAEFAYANALRIQPGDADAMLHLGRLLGEDGDLHGAAHYLLNSLRADFTADAAVELRQIIARVAPRARFDFLALLAGPDLEHAHNNSGDRVFVDVSPWIDTWLRGRPLTEAQLEVARAVGTMLTEDPAERFCSQVDGYADWLLIPQRLFMRLLAADARHAADAAPAVLQRVNIDLELLFCARLTIRPSDRIVLVGEQTAVDHSLFLSDARRVGAIVIGRNDVTMTDTLPEVISRSRNVIAENEHVSAVAVPVPLNVPLGLCTGGGGLGFRAGRGWLAPDASGSWSHPAGAELELPSPDLARVRIALLLHGLPTTDCAYRIVVEGQPAVTGNIQRGALRWIAFDVSLVPDEPIRLFLKGEELELVGPSGAGYRPLGSVGVVGIYLCDADDLTDRAALVETVALGVAAWS